MKTIHWLGSSFDDLLKFPKNAKKEAGYNLDRVQRGLEPHDWKPMKSIGASVKEIRIHEDSEYRVIYIAKFASRVYVLHAFVKKTQKTRQQDIQLAKDRLKQLQRELKRYR